MTATELDSAVLPNGQIVQRGNDIVVRKRINLGGGDSRGNPTLYPGKRFTISAIEFESTENDLIVRFDNGPLDWIDWGDPDESGFSGLVQQGALVILP